MDVSHKENSQHYQNTLIKALTFPLDTLPKLNPARMYLGFVGDQVPKLKGTSDVAGDRKKDMSPLQVSRSQVPVVPSHVGYAIL